MIENRLSTESKFMFNNKDLRQLSPEPLKFNTNDSYSTLKARTTLPQDISRKRRSTTHDWRTDKSVSMPTATIPRSWTDNSFFRNNIDCYLIKYSQMSRSERFLDLLELSKTQEWSRTTLNSLDSISSMNSPLFTPKNQSSANHRRNLPKYHEGKLNDSSSEESIASSPNNINSLPEDLVEPQCPVVFMCDPDDLSCTNSTNKPLEENSETSDLVAKTEVMTSPVPENLSDNNVNKIEEEDSGSSSSLLSTTLNDSQGSSGDISSSVKSTSPSDTTDNLSSSNILNNEFNQTLSERDVFEKDMSDIRPKEKTTTSSPNDSSEEDDEDDEDDFLIRMSKKSCLKKFLQDLNEECSLLDSTANATSSPLGSPRSMNSSLQWSSTTCEGENQSLSSSSVNSSMQRREKKRVSFADVCGKDLFTVRTMSEPSNCPPKLTSKIVQYFLNREFNYGNQMTDYSYNQNSYHSSEYYASRLQRRDSFFSTSRSYDYGINASNYTNDVNQLKGSIAVYSLNFGQPAIDYFKFRQRLEENSMSLENVLLNGFQINGTVKVKNISFEKKVFIRCSFNKWKDYQDYEASYVTSDFFSGSNSMDSPSGSSYSAAFCGTNNVPVHKEYDTFRFEFKLPKHAEPDAMTRPSANNYKSNITASIEFCICYQSGAGNNMREFWDSNGGSNYEILQYVIDLERLKNHHLKNGSVNKYQTNKKNYFNASGIMSTGIALDNEIYY